jgi:predicted XRE-type DNA-binding protein
MKTRIVDGMEVERSSGNVYGDLGLPDAEKLKIKTGLVIEIRKAMRRLDLTQQAAAKRMGITQPKVLDMIYGRCCTDRKKANLGLDACGLCSGGSSVNGLRARHLLNDIG